MLEQKATRTGFTLIELSFSIAFIAILLITITLISNEIIKTYRKGYSIKAINQTGRSLIEDFSASVQKSSASDIASMCSGYSNSSECESDSALSLIYRQFYNTIRVNGEEKTVPYAGIFCSGSYSYIWNTGYALSNDSAYSDKTSDPLELKINGTTVASDFRLIKVNDSERNACKTTVPYTSSYIPSNDIETPPQVIDFNTSETNPEIDELISASDTSLALYDLVISSPAHDDNNHMLYSGSFILATLSGGVDIMSADNYCKIPNGFDIDFSYCAINKFNFSARSQK